MDEPGAPSPSPRTWEWVLPYGAWALCLSGWVLHTMAEPVAALAPPLTGPLRAAGVALAVTGILSIAGLWLIAWRRSSASGRRAILVAGAVLLGTLTLASWWLPPEPQAPMPSRAADLLARRLTSSHAIFRGTEVATRFNHLGWPDNEMRLEARSRVVFLGDSFLEVRSSQNLAARVEAALSAEGLDADVVNMAQADTGPVPEYRHWFFEQALPYKPARVVLFLYALNDLAPGFRFEAYRAPEIRVSVDAGRLPGLGPRLSAALTQLAAEGFRFGSRAALVRRLPDGVDGDLAYLAVLATATVGSRRGPGATVAKLAGGLLAQARQWRRRERNGAGCVAQPWQESWAAYQQIFRQSEPTRLDAIGRFIAERYCEATDATRYIEALRLQPPAVRQFIAAEADMPYYLFPAVAAAAGAVTPAARPLPELGLAIESYVRLLEEMDAAARHQGATLEVVLIPEASMADAEFRAFWRGMPLPSEPLSIAHALHRSLASALANTGIRTLDLADEPGLLDGAYWFLDGHFNDTGNARVASRVARWLHP